MQKVKRKGSIYLKICINKRGGKTDINIKKSLLLSSLLVYIYLV